MATVVLNPLLGYNATSLPREVCLSKQYMPIRLVTSARLGNFPGVLIFEKEGNYSSSPPCFSSKEHNGGDVSLLPMISHSSSAVFKFTNETTKSYHSIENIYADLESNTQAVHRDTRNLTARISIVDHHKSLERQRLSACGSRLRKEICISVYEDEAHSQPQSPRRGDSESEEGYGGHRRYEMLAQEIEPYPLPEPPGLLLLEPLLLVHDVREETKRAKRRKEQLTPSEQQKLARIMIAYTLAFFLLAILTFYVVYFV